MNKVFLFSSLICSIGLCEAGLSIKTSGEILTGGQIKRGNVVSTGNNSAYGIKADEGDLRMHTLVFEPKVEIGNVASIANNAYGFYSLDDLLGPTNHLNSGGMISIGNITANKQAYGIYDKGKINYRSNEGSLKIGDITAEGGDSVGIFVTGSYFKPKGVGYIELISSTLELGKISSSANVYGIYADNNSKINIKLDNSTLSMSLEEKSSPKQEAIFYSKDNGQISVSMQNHSSLLIDGNGGTLNQLDIIGGENHIDLAGKFRGQLSLRKQNRTLIVENLKGHFSHSVTFSLFANTANGWADKIVVKNADSANVRLNILYDMQFPNTPLPQNELIVLEDQTGRLNVDLLSYADIDFNQIETKIYKKQERTDKQAQYYIKPSERPKISVSPTAITQSLHAITSNYLAFMGGVDTLDKRMGELKNNLDRSGIWSRIVFGGEQAWFEDFKQSLNYFSFQAGGDTRYSFNQSNLFVGVMGSYIRGLDDELNAGEIGAYGTLIYQNGYFIDTQAKIGIFNHQPKLENTKSENINSFAMSLSSELGKRFGMGKKSGFFSEITTKATLAYLYTPNFRFNKNNGAFLDTSSSHEMLVKSRVGGKIGYNIARGEHISDIFIAGYLTYQYLHSNQIDFHTQTQSTNLLLPSIHTLGFVFSFGTNIEINQNSKIYADIDAGGASGFYDIYKLNIGMRFNF